MTGDGPSVAAGRADASLSPPDQAARDAIVNERRRNVTVVAGAGTGKTRTVIDRALELLAPGDGTAAVPITRVAAITFTRRAAGELRFRLRERLLRELERAARAGGPRAGPLGDALSNLDAAFIGTIHGFADRLLRLRPVEAQLSPAYVLVEDNGELVHETFLRLRRAAEAATLRADLGRHAQGLPTELLDEVGQTLRAAARAGVPMERREHAFGPADSVEGILADMIETRDVPVAMPPIPEPGLAAARAAATRLEAMRRTMRGDAAGHRRLHRRIRLLQRLGTVADAAEAFRLVSEAQRGRPLYKGRDFNDDVLGWSIYQALREVKPNSLAEQLQGPHRWLAARFVRMFPVVAAMYERVKEEHEVVDYLDLLIKLRNLLRDDPQARGFYQRLFAHIFVDEFQDTDPLQCEIVFYLCENGTAASDWTEVELAPGKLTIVGDPKQSIYRFRRADIAMYARAVARLAAAGALEQRLATNFRSRPELIRFFNARLAAVLGEQQGGAFDPRQGRAAYEPLQPAASIAPGGVCVHLLRYADAQGEGLVAADGRAIEGAAVARYIRWLLAARHPVRDPQTNQERPVRPGDIAVLAPVTTGLGHLLRRLDELGVEYTARGGVLFLAHPTVRRYLLALRAIADRDDGVALAALLQPPFFALDWADVVAGRAGAGAGFEERRQRFEAARALIRDLRSGRHRRTPGAVARDLIERTALGRTVATGPNGRQTLAALYEVAAELDRRAGIEGLDFDAATEVLRGWAEAPAYLDAPGSLGHDAVRVMTVHQAKGLEFPVVVVWDGFQTFSEVRSAGWRVDRDARAWALRLGSIAVEYPAGCRLLEREKVFAEHERRRLYYVATTRARDLLVLPLPLTKSDRLPFATRALAQGADASLARELATFSPAALPEWACRAETEEPVRVVGDAALQRRLEAATERLWAAAAAAACPVAVPTAVSLEAAGDTAQPAEAEVEAERARKVAGARYGPLFGQVVHRALELMLSEACPSVAEAVRRAAVEAGTQERLPAAAADVHRALAALQRHGLRREAGWILRPEYPLCAAMPGGKLMSGFIDLLAIGPGDVVLVDFKTDVLRDGPVDVAYPVYAAQLRLYREALHAGGWVGDRAIRPAVLLTAAGELRWVEPDRAAKG